MFLTYFVISSVLFLLKSQERQPIAPVLRFCAVSVASADDVRVLPVATCRRCDVISGTYGQL